MLVELSKDELHTIKAVLNWAIYWMENKPNIENISEVLKSIDKELSKHIGE